MSASVLMRHVCMPERRWPMRVLKRARVCVQACACVDKCLKELLDVCDEVNGRWLVTSDHGNADDMVQRSKKGAPLYEEGRPVPLTSHTLAPVGVAVGGAGLPSSVKARHPPPYCHACATAESFARAIRDASAICCGSRSLACDNVCSCWDYTVHAQFILSSVCS